MKPADIKCKWANEYFVGNYYSCTVVGSEEKIFKINKSYVSENRMVKMEREYSNGKKNDLYYSDFLIGINILFIDENGRKINAGNLLDSQCNQLPTYKKRSEDEYLLEKIT